MQLARLLHEDGAYRVSVAALDGSGVLRGEIEKLQIGEIAEFPLDSFYDANFARQLIACARFMRRNNIEIVQTSDFYTNIFGMFAARLAGVRARVASKRETEAMRSRAQKTIEKTAFRFAHKIAVNAEAVRRFLIAQNVADAKITTVYNGLDLARLEPKQSREIAAREFGLPPDKKIVTLVANLRHKVKNQPMFLRAARRVLEKSDDAVFVLAGEGELIDELKALARELNIANRAYFIGRCTNVPDLLACSDVGVLTSIAEGFSNSILEYMAARLPVAATNVGGAAEAVSDGETGFLVASNDDAMLAEKILRLLENPDLAKKMGARAREVVETRFSLQAQLGATKNLYNQILNQRARGLN